MRRLSLQLYMYIIYVFACVNVFSHVLLQLCRVRVLLSQCAFHFNLYCLLTFRLLCYFCIIWFCFCFSSSSSSNISGLTRPSAAYNCHLVAWYCLAACVDCWQVCRLFARFLQGHTVHHLVFAIVANLFFFFFMWPWLCALMP